MALIVGFLILAIVGGAVGGSIASRKAREQDEREAAASAAASAAEQATSVEPRGFQTENVWSAQTTVAIRGRKPSARGPVD